MSTSPAALDLILSRVSPARLAAPAPSGEQLQQLLQAGARAPDHGRLRPWRFVVIAEAARPRFGELMAQSAKSKHPDASEADLQRERDKAMRAPMIIVVAAKITPPGKIPEVEQMHAVAACAQNMMLAAQALGYGAMWKTGDAAYDPSVKTGLGLGADDAIIAFLYVGTVAAAPAARAPELEGLVHHLAPN